jgi:peptidoglycan/LPS O-acetylase OafA/YrhL
MKNVAQKVPNLPSLTGLRFVAATMVFLHHAATIGQVPILSAWQGFGTTGVSFFYVLSGFVLTWSNPADVKISTFFAHRFFRIWPLMALSTLLAIPVFYYGRNRPIETTAILLQLFALQAWFNNAKLYYGGNPANWSLSNEAFFYLAHPFIYRATRRIGPKQIVLLVALIAAVQISLAYIFIDFFPHQRVWLTYIFPGFRIFEFILGMMAARYVLAGGSFFEKFGSPGFGMAMASCWFFVFYMLAPQLPKVGRLAILHLHYAVMPAIYAYIICAAATVDLRFEPTLFSKKVMVKLGQWSFAMYLTHATIIYGYRQYFGVLSPSNSNLIRYTILLLFSVIVAAVLHEFIEAPLNDYLRKRWRNWSNRKSDDSALQAASP